MRAQNYLIYNATISKVTNWFLLSLLFFPVVLMCQRSKNSISVGSEYQGKIFIAIPKKLSMDTNTVFSIIAYNVPDNEVLKVSIKDFPGMTKVFSSKRVTLKNGIPVFLNIKLHSEKLLRYTDVRFGGPKVYVLVEAKIGQKFNKKIKLLVEHDKRYVFLQTDKPIYNQQQRVQIRIIPLNEKLLPENYKIRVQIKNPQDIIVQETLFTEPWKQSSGQFPRMNFTFPPFCILGKWKIEVSYGINFQQKTSVAFRVEEYTLPTFTVKLQVPDVILPESKVINFTVQAEYVYGKKLNGIVVYALNVVNKYGEIFPAGTKSVAMKEGETKISLCTLDVLKMAKVEYYSYKSILSVNVSVIDAATGMMKNSREERIKFVKSPFIISFKNSFKYYKPGIVSVIVADITYLNGRSAANIPTLIKITDASNKDIRVNEWKHNTDRKGRVIYYVTPPADTAYLHVIVKTRDCRYKSGQQASGTHTMYKFPSENFVAISRTASTRKAQIGEKFVANVYAHPASKLKKLFYLVMARGKILLLEHLHIKIFQQKRLEFVITTEMSPVIRILLFSLLNKELLVDSMRIEVEEKCEAKSEVTVTPDFTNKRPGGVGKFILKGESKTKVGLLVVDKVAFSLKNQGKITREDLFQRIASYDYGSGLGEGENSQKTLFNSGLFLFGNFEIENKMNKENDRMGINYLKSVKFKETDEEDFIDPYDDEFYFHDVDIDKGIEEEISLRTDFPDTWLFEDFEIGSDGIAVANTKLPNGITSWTMQTISISPQWGMCISNLMEVKSFKSVFLRVNFPHSVVRNEELYLEATVINYFPQKLPVTVYFCGVKNLYTGVKEGEKSEQKKIIIDPLSARTVNFLVVPLEAGDYFIRIVALSHYDEDTVVKKLHVVAEGVTEEVDIFVTLDPTNQQKKKKLNVVTEVLSGTECGPTLQTTLLDPQHLIEMPFGRCDQTMMYMGLATYTFNLLKNRDKINMKIEKRLYDIMSEGYERALSFRNKDGSFSVWKHKPSSI
ncbi:complement C3-like isoform X2 [Centruroides sculpturatus]|uniref:complement C3-like isoform X2 n=1 Tax=Centruroides sculpturatus TaxID=218467 RepID=UPI000C6E9DE5|nr:complement C3-like isoform X2 [Centruroides sculpturatus]